MPEMPDVEVYVSRLAARLRPARLQRIELLHPFVLRSTDPAPAECEGRAVVGAERMGKRIVLALQGELFVVIHLMIAGRLHWIAAGGSAVGRGAIAALVFDVGTLRLTEAGTRRRASIHLLRGRPALQGMDPGGIDPVHSSAEEFDARLRSENHTLKRALTDPRLFSGIGNAYSDEILHRARLSPLRLTRALDPEESRRLHAAAGQVLQEWIARLDAEAGDWPRKVTAFHPAMAVHGRHGQPCPVCGAPVQRIVHAENEMNYCARCQTDGRLLADRALSRLLKASWPRHLDDLA